MAFPEKIKIRAIELYKGCSAIHALKALEKEFPDQPMPDERSIRRWRNRELLKRHFENMAGIAALLISELDVIKNPTSSSPFEYTIWNGYSVFSLTREWLGSKLEVHIEMIEERHPDLDWQSFLSHLAEELPEINRIGLALVATANPYELFQTLKRMATEKLFKGKCPTCKHLH